MERIVLYTKDIQILTGKSERTARALLSKIRSEFNKESGSMVTVYDLARFLDCDVAVLKRNLK